MGRKVFLFILIFSIILTIGCTNKDILTNSDQKTDIEKTIEYLASEKFKGRLTGTENNKEVERFLAESFEKIGLEKYKDNSFFVPYKHNFYNPKNQKFVMVLEFDNNTKEELIYGKDFLPQNMIANLTIEGNSTFDINDKNIQNSVVVLDNLADLQKIFNKAKAVLIKKKNFNKYIVVRDSGFPIIQISERVYDLIKDRNCKVKVKYNLKKEKIEANNIVGIIKGGNNENALVISAHFDHVGAVADKVFYGAVDNSSGVAVLLNLAEKLIEYSKKNKLDYDIIICAFNGEEFNLQGSRAFVNEILHRYDKIYNINIDSIGYKNGDKLLITGDGIVSGYLIDDIDRFFTQNGYQCQIETEGAYISDHISFSEKNIPSINLSDSNVNVIHTENDITDKIDFEYLNKISDTLFDYIILNVEKLFNIYNEEKSITEHIQNDKEREEMEIDKEKEKLKFGQYKFVNIDDEIYLIYKQEETFSDIEEINKVFPNFKIQKNIDNYEFKSATVLIDTLFPKISEHVIGQIYEDKEISSDRIKYFSLNYLNKADEDNFIEINVKIQNEKYGYINSFFGEHKIEKKQIVVNGQTFDILYDGDSKHIVFVETQYSKNNKDYIISIGKHSKTVVKIKGETKIARKFGWSDDSLEDVIDFLKKINIDNLAI
ncbi:Peptidase family M28 [Caloranaerobacter azorensis DSM 13643]|uniref:Peptidase family M28 n=1 Tax=Caloranaerobacter azorensis DSM 13643 TaxID=1121264 RepID=A0A1M5W2Q1_9FIRM|nr:M28 family metallopeptidase [Caloranaerobacter azorensis]SHH81494.1 Peptidase family M28 [Caloranaerobacter azorensis DSM 13643]